MKTAEEMISVAATHCKVDVVKFQKRTISEMSLEDRGKPYDNPNSFGATYGEHREALEFDIKAHGLLKEVCDVYGVEYSCSVWDLPAARELISLGPKSPKVPSARNMDMKLIDWLIKNFDGQIHVSMGMTTKAEKIEILHRLWPIRSRAVVYICTSAYPAPMDSLCLGDIKEEMWDGFTTGLSGHHLGIAIDMVAAMLGFKYIERHFTLDRASKGTDHAASLEPEGMRKLKRDLDAMVEATKRSDLGVKACEEKARAKLKRS